MKVHFLFLLVSRTLPKDYKPKLNIAFINAIYDNTLLIVTSPFKSMHFQIFLQKIIAAKA